MVVAAAALLTSGIGTSGGWLGLSSAAFFSALLSILGVSMVWWRRERRLTRLRQSIQRIHSLSEEILWAPNAAQIMEKLGAGLPEAIGAGKARIYLYDRAADCLRGVGSPPVSMVVGTAPAATASLAVRCAAARKGLEDLASPAALVCLPMLAHSQLDGVLELTFPSGGRLFHPDEIAAVQHLANQAALALRLLDERLLREQVLRSEKLGAVGQLISGIADELRAPLEMIAGLSEKMLGHISDEGMTRDLRAIANETAGAASTLGRLVSFGRAEQARARRVALHPLLRGLMEFRAQQWRLQNVEAESRLTQADLSIVAAQGQIEQALLSILVHIEQSLLNAAEKRLTVSTLAVGEQALLAFEYSAPLDDKAVVAPDASLGAWGLAVSRGIIENHGGELRHRAAGSGSRFEVLLPLATGGTQAAQAAPRHSGAERALTLLLIEPETAVQRQLLTLLSARNHRVVPASSGQEGLDMALRLRFDGVLSTARLPDLTWTELLERTRRHCGGFVLLAEGFDPDRLRSLEARDGLRLHKPIDEDEVDKVLVALAGRGRPAAQ